MEKLFGLFWAVAAAAAFEFMGTDPGKVNKIKGLADDLGTI